MNSKKKKSIDLIDHFGNDFEVSYEDETPLTYKIEPDSRRKKKKKDIGPNVMNVSSDTIYAPKSKQHRPAHTFETFFEDDFEDASYNKYDNYGYDDEYSDEYDNEYDDDYDDEYDNEYDDDYDDEYDDESYHSSRRRRNKKMTPIAAPIKKSTKAAYSLIQTLLRNLSLALILAIIVYMTVNFIKGSVPYGNLEEELRTQDFSYKLVGYFTIAACLIFYEFLAALWTMSKARIRDQYGKHKVDVGRGLFSFIFIYLCSYASFLISNHIPEIHDAVLGAQGALTVFGSMHNVLFGICTAGVISCLLRKYHL